VDGHSWQMRVLRSVTLLSLLFCATASSPVSAQSVTNWHPRPTFGLGLGVSDDGNYSGDGRHLLLSATLEVPLATVVRVRIDAARTSQPIPAIPSRALPADLVRIARVTVSVATTMRPGLAPIRPYGGLGIGRYRASFRYSPARWQFGGYVHGGIEVQASDAVAIDGEVGLHVIPRTLYPEGALLGEMALRVKVGLF
jgi:hypothetical protein